MGYINPTPTRERISIGQEKQYTELNIKDIPSNTVFLIDTKGGASVFLREGTPQKKPPDIGRPSEALWFTHIAGIY